MTSFLSLLLLFFISKWGILCGNIAYFFWKINCKIGLSHILNLFYAYSSYSSYKSLCRGNLAQFFNNWIISEINRENMFCHIFLGLRLIKSGWDLLVQNPSEEAFRILVNTKVESSMTVGATKLKIWLQEC